MVPLKSSMGFLLPVVLAAAVDKRSVFHQFGQIAAPSKFLNDLPAGQKITTEMTIAVRMKYEDADSIRQVPAVVFLMHHL